MEILEFPPCFLNDLLRAWRVTTIQEKVDFTAKKIAVGWALAQQSS